MFCTFLYFHRTLLPLRKSLNLASRFTEKSWAPACASGVQMWGLRSLGVDVVGWRYTAMQTAKRSAYGVLKNHLGVLTAGTIDLTLVFFLLRDWKRHKLWCAKTREQVREKLIEQGNMSQDSDGNYILHANGPNRTFGQMGMF